MQKPKTEDLQKQLDEVTNSWKRALADYQNLEKRTQLEKEEFFQFANRELLAKLLPVLDSLEKLEQHLKDEAVKLILSQFHEILRQEGLEKIEVSGKDFNPEEMECIEAVEGKKGETENKVIEEARPGYRLKGKVVRVAQVRVTKKQ